jgi:hypothetical protein
LHLFFFPLLVFFSLLGGPLYDDVTHLILPHRHWLDLLLLERCGDGQVSLLILLGCRFFMKLTLTGW